MDGLYIQIIVLIICIALLLRIIYAYKNTGKNKANLEESEYNNLRNNQSVAMFLLSIIPFAIIIVFISNFYAQKSKEVNSLEASDTNSVKIDSSKTDFSIEKNTSIYSIVDTVTKLGGYEKVSVYEDPNKCNLFIGRFFLKKPIIDSGLLIQFVDYLAKKVVDEYDTEKSCPYVTMSVVHLYMNERDLKRDDQVAVSSVTPSEPNGSGVISYRFGYYREKRNKK